MWQEIRVGGFLCGKNSMWEDFRVGGILCGMISVWDDFRVGGFPCGRNCVREISHKQYEKLVTGKRILMLFYLIKWA